MEYSYSILRFDFINIMNSFQRQTKKASTCKLSQCTHGRSMISCAKNNKAEEKVETAPVIEAQVHEHHVDEIKPCVTEEDKYITIMRSLIDANEDYFQNKVKVCDNVKPNDLKLKIPSQTGSTTYKKDYLKNSKSQGNIHSLTPKFEEKKISSGFFGTTTYQNQYLGKQTEDNRMRKKIEKSIDENAPAFYDTSYKNNFLNWGGKNFVPSMKPDPKPSVLSVPLQSKSVYKLEYTEKPQAHTQSFKPVGPCLSLSGSKGFDPQKHSSAMNYMTTNKEYFNQKAHSKQASLKPKVQSTNMGDNAFRGSTQYRSEFHQNGERKRCKCVKKPLAELQNLILKI